MPDSNEAPRQNVLGKAAEELRRFQSHFLLLVAVRVVLGNLKPNVIGENELEVPMCEE